VRSLVYPCRPSFRQHIGETAHVHRGNTLVVRPFNGVPRVARSIRDPSRTVGRVRDAGTELHVVSRGLMLQPDDEDLYRTALFQLLGVFAELESKTERHTISGRIAARQRNEAYHHAPTPLGSEEADDRLVEVLDRVARGELSRRRAATEAATSRRTVQRSAEDRAELHGP
jgi:DNA invertase Pin-like site-specific DNA recombinase